MREGGREREGEEEGYDGKRIGEKKQGGERREEREEWEIGEGARERGDVEGREVEGGR